LEHRSYSYRLGADLLLRPETRSSPVSQGPALNSADSPAPQTAGEAESSAPRSSSSGPQKQDGMDRARLAATGIVPAVLAWMVYAELFKELIPYIRSPWFLFASAILGAALGIGRFRWLLRAAAAMAALLVLV